MRVEMITDGLPVRSGKVFIVQRGHDIHVEDGLFRLLPVSKPTGWSNVITIFLRSLIHHWNGQIVAVILSGLDGDGAAALPELKGAGGIIIVQQCDTATNQDMPRSAIQTGCVDFVLPVGNIGAEIARIVTAEAGKS
jgi:chemotaxis response regulator CheB